MQLAERGWFDCLNVPCCDRFDDRQRGRVNTVNDPGATVLMPTKFPPDAVSCALQQNKGVLHTAALYR